MARDQNYNMFHSTCADIKSDDDDDEAQGFIWRGSLLSLYHLVGPREMSTIRFSI